MCVNYYQKIVNKKTSQLKYQIVIIFTLGVFLYYLVYRFRYTINPDVLWLSILFLYADVHGFISLSLFAFQLWNPIERENRQNHLQTHR